jgi:hypothetical protein
MSDKPAPKPVREDVVTIKRTGRPDTAETFRTGLPDRVRKDRPAGVEKP